MATPGLITATTTYPSVYPSSFQPAGVIGNTYPMVSPNYSNPGQYYGNMQQPYPAMSQPVFSTGGAIAPPPPYSNIDNTNLNTFNNKF